MFICKSEWRFLSVPPSIYVFLEAMICRMLPTKQKLACSVMLKYMYGEVCFANNLTKTKCFMVILLF